MKTLITLLLFVNLLYSQVNPGARQIAMSNSDVAQANDVFSLFNNPAGLSQISWREIGIFHSPSPFGLKQLANTYAAYIEPSPIGNFSIGFKYYGFELYKESSFYFAYSSIVYEKLLMGISFAYDRVSIENYGSSNALMFNLGSILYFTEDFRFGFYTTNLNRGSFKGQDDRLPVSYHAGVSYDVNTDLTANASLYKELNFKPSLRFGIDYSLLEYFNLLIGVSNEPSIFSGGIGINYKFFEIDYSVFTHNDLGLTHQLGLIISLEDRSNRKQKIRDLINESSIK